MEFQKYTSIENHYREKTIQFLRMNGMEKMPYELTEKIHGANFSFWCNGNDVRVASRNMFVDGSFYGSQEVIDKYAPMVRELWKEHAPLSIAVYGELYGPSVQKGIKIRNRKRFRCL